MNILRIAMNGEEFPHYTLTEAFEKTFDKVHTIWWQAQPIEDLNKLIINTVQATEYDAVFLQLQSDNIINEEAAKAIKDNSIGFNWTGDVRTDISWYRKMGKYFVTCFTNMNDVESLREFGLHAEYLQTGYDHKFYYPKKSPCHENIVFCANYYSESSYPLTDLRREIVIALRREFGDRFNLYGANWKNCGISAEYEHVYNEDEAEIYRTAAIAINCSHFNYSRYSSDRIFREMGSGAFVLSHKYRDIAMDFKEGEHLATWSSIPELIRKCHYYLEQADERKRIAYQGMLHVQDTAKWTERLKDFKELVYKYKQISKTADVHGMFL